MSFLGFGKPQPTLAEKMSAAEQELEMITDMFNRFYPPLLLSNIFFLTTTPIHRLTRSCHNKCIPTDYREADLNKGESVCLDRCVSKFFDVNIKV